MLNYKLLIDWLVSPKFKVTYWLESYSKSTSKSVTKITFETIHFFTKIKNEAIIINLIFSEMR